MKSLQELGNQDRTLRGIEFCRMARHFAQARGSAGDALRLAEQTRAGERIQTVLRAAVGAGSTSIGSPSAWGDELSSYRMLQAGFLDSLRSASAFARMLSDGALVRVPTNSRVGIVANDATAYIVGAGQPVPVSRLDLGMGDLVPQKAASLIVVTEELLSAAASGAEAAFGRHLRDGVAVAIDSTFLSAAVLGIAATPATASPMADLRGLLNAVNTTGAGRLYWVMPPAVANLMSTLVAVNGNSLFPEMSPVGGELLGLPVVVTSAANYGGSPAADSITLVDATGVAGDIESIELRMSRETALQMENVPTGNAMTGSGTTVVSMFQANLVALEAIATFAALRVRANSVALLEGIAWT